MTVGQMWLLYTCLFFTAVNGLMCLGVMRRADWFNARAREIDDKLVRLRRRRF